METPKTTFRLDLSLLRLADRLLAEPPTIVIDDERGKPRNRTELVANLLRHAGQVQEKEQQAKGEKR